MEVFQIEINGSKMDFFCGTYATEKTLESLGIGISDIGDAFDTKFIPTLRHFIYFSAKDAQRLKTPKGETIDFPYELDDVYNWIDGWGGGQSTAVAEFTIKLYEALFGKIKTEPEKPQKKSPKSKPKK